MAFTLSRVSAATMAFWITTTIAVSSVGTLVAMTISLGTGYTQAGTLIHTVTLAAAALDIVGLLSALAAASMFILRVVRKTQMLCCTGFALFAVATAVVTMYSFAQLWNTNSRSSEDSGSNDTVITIVQAGFAIWAVAVFSQILLYAIILWPYKRDESDLPASELAARLHRVQSPKRSISVRLASLSSPRTSPVDTTLSDPTASHFSSPSLSPRSSFRRSVTQKIRPMTSKTRLLFRSSIISRDSPSLYSGRDTSMETPRLQNEFRDWDTSGAIGQDEQTNDPFTSSRSTRTRLEPIPGSRPVSPAKPLDGPFGCPTPPEELPLPDSPMTSPTLAQSDIGSFRARPRAPSRPHSNQSHHSQEAHIHPLFRSESPHPPPIASPGTIITASTHAGQIVNSDQGYFPPPRILRSAQGSRPASPSPLSPSGAAASPLSRSRQGSCRSLRMQQASPVEPRSASALSWEVGKEG